MSTPTEFEKYYLSNLQPDPIDERDYLFTASTSSLPTSVDLRVNAGAIENQLNTGSCVANATVSALEMILQKGGKFRDLSRLFLYYNLREPYANLKNQDAGAYLRDGFKFVNQLGICDEKTWEFNPTQVNTKPSESAYTEALNHKVTRYERIPGFSPFAMADFQAILLMKAALAKGYPVCISMTLGSKFYSISGPLETHNYYRPTGDSIGGHAMNVVGYSDAMDGFIVENSWGTGWGDKGYCLLKYTTIMADVNDVWVCTGFDGLEFNPEWVDDSPELKVESQTITHYKEDGKVYNIKASVISGTPPYTYNWYTVAGYNGSVDYINNVGESNTATLLGDYKRTAIYAKITDSSTLKKTAVQYFTLEYKDEPKPVPVEPIKPVEPVAPTEEKSKTTTYIVIGVVVAIIAGIVAYSNGLIQF